MPRNCTVFLLPRRLTRSAIYGSQIFDSHKWPTVLVRTVKGKPRNFEANLCGSLYSTFKTSFQPYAFYKKRLQTLFIDQLVRSKAMCSFNRSMLTLSCLPLVSRKKYSTLDDTIMVHCKEAVGVSSQHPVEQKHEYMSTVLAGYVWFCVVAEVEWVESLSCVDRGVEHSR